jgi:DNA repair exonuclease SbcCD ATPase subunit
MLMNAGTGIDLASGLWCEILNMNIRQNRVLRLLCHGTAVLFLAGSLLPEAMAASNKDSKERQALRRVQAQLNEVQQQKSLLEQEKTGLAEQMEELKKKSAALESGTAKANARRIDLDREVEDLSKDKVELSAKLQETSRGLQEMTKKQAEAMQTLQHKEREIKRFEAELAHQTRQGEMCQVKNAQLYQINAELMDKYQSKGVFGALLQAEPFTQLKSVEMENLLQEYRDKLDAQRVEVAK